MRTKLDAWIQENQYRPLDVREKLYIAILVIEKLQEALRDIATSEFVYGNVTVENNQDARVDIAERVLLIDPEKL